MRVLTTFCCVMLACSAFAQEDDYSYYYVYDTDNFCYGHEKAGIWSAVTDTLFNLQIVKTDRREKEWLQVVTGAGPRCWVHASRLKPMAERTFQHLDNVYFRQGGFFNAFIAGPDVPHILIHCSSPICLDPLPVDDDSYRQYIRLGIGYEDCFAFDLISGETVWYWGIDAWPRFIRIYNERVMISDENAEYAFVRSGNGRVVMNIIPVSSLYLREFTQEQIEEAIAEGHDFIRRCDSKTREKIEGFAYDYNHPYCHALMHKLRTAYFSGDSRAAEIYPQVLETMRSDGSGTEEKMSYQYELWVRLNAGAITLEELRKYL